MINNKVTSNNLQSQVVKTRKNKKRVIKRKSSNKFALLSIAPIEIRYKIAKEIADTLASLTPRSRHFVMIFFRELIRSGKQMSDKARSYFMKACEYTCEKTISRLITLLEKYGLIEVTQYFKDKNVFKEGPSLKCDIIKNYLIRFAPSLRFLFPFLVSTTMLLSASQKEENVTGRNVPLLSMLYKDLNLRGDDCASKNTQEVIKITKKRNEEEERRKLGINPKEYREEKTVRTPIPAAKINYVDPTRIGERRSGLFNVGALAQGMIGKPREDKGLSQKGESPVMKAERSMYTAPKPRGIQERIAKHSKQCCDYRLCGSRSEKIGICRKEGMAYEDDQYVTPGNKDYLCGIDCEPFREFSRQAYEMMTSIEAKANYLRKFMIGFRVHEIVDYSDGNGRKKKIRVDAPYRHLIES